jgi:sulfatase maturation enzyme AslB (radical SAM superfamily)
VSLDGYGEIHDKVRGIPKVFKKTFETIKEIKANRSLYCDSFDVGCTVISQNVNYLEQLNAFAKKIEIQIKFRMGIENKRIESEKLFPSFSGFNGKGLFSSKTFFYSQYKNSKTISDKFKYFSIFNSINNGRSKRLMGCNWKNQGITLDSRGNIYYCAVESECIGNLKNTPGEKIFFDEAHLKYRESIVQNKCDSCVHDYYGNPEIKNFLIFVFQVLHERFWAKIYAFKLRFMI